MKKKKDKTASDVRNDMVLDMDAVRAGTLKAKDAAVLVNIFGKSISSALAQIVVAKACNKKPTVSFLSDAK